MSADADKGLQFSWGQKKAAKATVEKEKKQAGAGGKDKDVKGAGHSSTKKTTDAQTE